VIGVCAGDKVVAAAGLLDGKRATTHWYYRRELLDRHPSIRYVADRRFVADRGVATTTGITASMPMSLTLIEAIAGRPRAEAVARPRRRALGCPAPQRCLRVRPRVRDDGDARRRRVLAPRAARHAARARHRRGLVRAGGRRLVAHLSIARRRIRRHAGSDANARRPAVRAGSSDGARPRRRVSCRR
jgi:putative intracellular protease/amidase